MLEDARDREVRHPALSGKIHPDPAARATLKTKAW